jgi:uncharacterized MAPEG superfamily protein
MSAGEWLPAADPRASAPKAHPLIDRGAVGVLALLGVVFLAPEAAWLGWSAKLHWRPPMANFEVIALVWSALLALALAIGQIVLHIRKFGGAAIRGNRDAYPLATGAAGRIGRAHANLLESLAPFAIVVLAAQALHVSTPLTVASAGLFLAARIVHAASYLLGVTVLRSAAFYAGVAATIDIARQLPLFG